MKIVFMGTPDFAVPCLKALVESGETVVGVFTQPDKPKGRGYTLCPPPVKVCAAEYGISVFQPTTFKDGTALETLKELGPELIVVTAYGKILPAAVLSLPKYGCINIHASLLPQYRGAAPIQQSVLDGQAKTGVTAMQMDVGLDTGDMLLKAETPIGENETAGELHDRLSVLGAEVLLKTLDALKKGTLQPEKQDDANSSYAGMLDKSLCPIDFTKSAGEVHNQVRGLYPWPVATAGLHGKRVKIYKTVLSDLQGKVPGAILSLDGGITVACGKNSVTILELQLEGKKRMASVDFLRGHALQIGDCLE